MNLINLMLILIILFILFYIIKKSYNKKNKMNKNKLTKVNDKDYLDELLQINNNINEDNNINPIFVESQYHNDYRDTITAFSNIVPCFKNVFNLSNLPVEYTVINLNNIDNVNKMINDFIKELNKIIIKMPDYRNPNTGWDELIPDKKVKSGWEKQMEKLGLPPNLYPEPAKKSKIYLLSIDRVEKYETDDELKYVIFLFIKKKYINDQLLIKVSFVMDKKLINEDRDFFKNKLEKNNKELNKNIMELEIIIEDIFVVGYMTLNNTIDTMGKKPDDFYNFEGLENQNMLNDKVILKELINKYKDRAKEMKQFSSDIYNENIFNNGSISNIMGINSFQKNILNERKFK